LGKENFPLIPETFYPSYKAVNLLPSFPTVIKVSLSNYQLYFYSNYFVKVGSASGGLGKMKVDDQRQWEDCLSITAMTPDYLCSEPFIDW